MGDLTKTDAVAPNALGSVQQLYDMISGKTTTTTGGNVSKVETGSMDQAGMNAMLQSALSSTSGLAAVAGGQRTAGGYGSATNQMLVNDLLTRSAGQIAQGNTTKTTTATTTPQVVQAGGVSAEGTLKTAGILKALQLLQGKDATLMDGVKRQLGMKEQASTAAQDAAGGGVNAVSYGNNLDTIPTNTIMGSTLSSGDTLGMGGTLGLSYNVPDFGSSAGAADSNAGSTDFIPAADPYSGGSAESTYVAPPTTEPGPDLTNWSDNSSFADGGLIGSKAKNSHPMVQSYADGGEVTTKKPSVLGTSQFAQVPSDSTVTSGSTSTNPAVSSVASSVQGGSAGNVSSASSSSSAGTLGDLGGMLSSGGSGIGDGSAATGGISSAGLGQAATGFGIAGALGHNSGLSAIGTAMGIASSTNPGLSTAIAMANAATHGIAGTIGSVSANPSIGNIADVAMAISNPALGIANAALGMVGMASISGIIGNIADAISPNNPMSTEQQAAVNDAVSDNAMAQAGENGPGSTGTTDASSIGATNGSDSMSDSFGGVGAGGFGGDSGLGAAGMGDAGPGGSSGDGGASGAGPGSDGGGPGGGGGDGGAGSGGGGDADGGLKQGPGTGISDSIPAKLSDGEFVLSADTVAAIGVDKLQALQDKYHVPAAVQRLQQFSRGRG